MVSQVDLIVEIAKQVKADAVWPGWGHASENPDLPNSLEAAGIVFMVLPIFPTLLAVSCLVPLNPVLPLHGPLLLIL